MNSNNEISKASLRARSKIFEQLYMERRRLLLSMGECEEEELHVLYDNVKELEK